MSQGGEFLHLSLEFLDMELEVESGLLFWGPKWQWLQLEEAHWWSFGTPQKDLLQIWKIWEMAQHVPYQMIQVQEIHLKREKQIFCRKSNSRIAVMSVDMLQNGVDILS